LVVKEEKSAEWEHLQDGVIETCVLVILVILTNERSGEEVPEITSPVHNPHPTDSMVILQEYAQSEISGITQSPLCTR